MLSRAEIQQFQSHRDYPSVSILAPTHRTAPANKQDPIKVKNLVSKAVKRLESEFSKREVAPVVKNLQSLVKQIQWNYALDGLALFASRDVAASLSLPFRVKPRMQIDETFATRDLVYAYNRATPYRVLVLGHEVRLFSGWTTVLEEHRSKPFPLSHKGRGGAAKLPGGVGINPSAIRDEDHRQFFRSVDEALAPLHKAQPLPLVVVGVERNLAFFREVTKLGDDFVGMLAGNHEKTSPHELGKQVWPVFELGATASRTNALVRLDQAVSAHRYASGIAQVWREIVGGKVRTLLVEKDYKYATDLAEDGVTLAKYTGEGPTALDDIVDESVEQVLSRGGEVFFYPPGDLGVHQKIAAVLRGK
ncbi:MAG: hypothetical protein SFU86_05245 [Pirellulaceae bacterium]|nr:hypothetical protein [Pirellulaceae bacterium]